MSKGDIPLHKEHGLNPSISLCFFCGKDKEILLFGAKMKEEAPHQAVYNKEPCEDCKELMSKGVLLIETRDGEKADNPFRTGRQWVVTREWAAEAGITSPMCWIEESMAKQIGLDKLTP
jgi:hypothetical protein